MFSVHLIHDNLLSICLTQLFVSYYAHTILPSAAHDVPQVKIHATVLMVLTALKRKQLVGPHSCAKATIEVYKSLIGQVFFCFQNVAELIRCIKLLGVTFQRVAPSELVIGNVVRRILCMIREEYAAQLKKCGTTTTTTATSSSSSSTSSSGSSGSAVTSTPPRRRSRGGSGCGTGLSTSASVPDANAIRVALARLNVEDTDDGCSASPSISAIHTVTGGRSSIGVDYTVPVGDLRSEIMGGLAELEEELESVYDPIVDVALDHVHQEETILALGESPFVSRFLIAAARKRKFHVLVAEGEPHLSGQRLAQILSNVPNIGVTLIPDSNLFALMSRVNKVVFSPLAVSAEGGAICTAGHAMMITAAKQMAVHVICLAASFMVTPLAGLEQTAILKQLHCPSLFVGYDEPAAVNLNVELRVPVSDYVPADNIDIYLTNNGCHLPASIGHVMGEMYFREDFNLLEEKEGQSDDKL